jgi:hypothetical protein
MVGITVDGPQTGSRLQKGDPGLGKLVGACGIDPKTGEDNAMFDVCNPRAIRDNIRQSALEIALIPQLLARPLHVSGGPDGDPCHINGATVDGSRLAIMGHSMGATITPLAVALQPKLKAVVLSGANGSYIENIVAKEMPSPLAPELEEMLGLGYCLDEFSMLSSLFQWAEEASDPVVYEQSLFADPKRTPPDVLMIQGIGDHYIPPPVANVNSMGMRLDLLGPPLDKLRPQRCTSNPEHSVPTCSDGRDRYPITEVVPLLAYAGTGDILEYPDGGVARNRDGGTRALVQYNRDAACRQDGHEVAYEIAKARWQYRCFLSSFAKGQAKVFAAPPGSADESVEIDVECPK